MAETITLSGVPETMLQTVYARAKESRGRGAIRDLKAEEIIGRLDYDFSLADKDAAMHSGVIARTIVLDRLVGEYLAAHPGATVMNLACGLDTRCYRMQGYITSTCLRPSRCAKRSCRRAAASRSSPCLPWTIGARRSRGRPARRSSSSRA
mgnify:CR=1 FL=1